MKHIIYRILILVLIGASLNLPSPLKAQATTPALLEGIEQFGEQQYDDAIRIISRQLAYNLIPQFELSKAHFFLGASYLKVLKHENKFRKKFPYAASRAYTHLAASRQLDHGGRYSLLAEESLDQLKPFLYNEGVRHYENKSYQKARYYFSKAQKIDPLDLDLMLGQSYVALGLKDSLKAQRIWRRIIQTETDTTNQVAIRAKSLMKDFFPEVNLDEPEKEETALVRQVPFPEAVVLDEGDIQVYQEKKLSEEEAIQLFERTLKDFPEDTRTALAYAELMRRRGNEKKAISLYQNILTYDPAQEQANTRMANHYLDKGAMLFKEIADKDGSLPAVVESYERVLAYADLAIKPLEILSKKESSQGPWTEKLTELKKWIEIQQE
jgi:hypothetical protein